MSMDIGDNQKLGQSKEFFSGSLSKTINTSNSKVFHSHSKSLQSESLFADSIAKKIDFDEANQNNKNFLKAGAISYELDILKHLDHIVPKPWHTFVEDALKDLAKVRNQPVGEYVGTYQKAEISGLGQMALTNGDFYKGNFRDGKRHGTGLCMFSSGAIYRGEWRNDVPQGPGTVFVGKNQIIEGKFDQGSIQGSPAKGDENFIGGNSATRIRYLFTDGGYYEGQFSNHKRNGYGVFIYPNGDRFDGQWVDDKRFGRGKMTFNCGHSYNGQFIADVTDGTGASRIEDKHKSLFRPVDGSDEHGRNVAGNVTNCRIQNKWAVEFFNGDKFVGMFKDGRPTGKGEMSYKNSVLMWGQNLGSNQFELAKYVGNFKFGKRDG